MSGDAVNINDANIINGDFRMEHINLNIKKGFITAVVGGNGSGKTTLIKAIAGIFGITRGEIYIEGFNLYTQPVEAKNMIGFIFHDNPFNKNSTPRDCAEMFGSMYGEFDNKKFYNLCSEFGVERNVKISKMSKGQVVKLQLAFAMAHDGKILLFDDAMEGLDPVFRRKLKKILRDITADGNHTVVMATKIPEDIENIGDYVVRLKDGKISETADIEQINEMYGGIMEYMKKGGTR